MGGLALGGSKGGEEPPPWMCWPIESKQCWRWPAEWLAAAAAAVKLVSRRVRVIVLSHRVPTMVQASPSSRSWLIVDFRPQQRAPMVCLRDFSRYLWHVFCCGDLLIIRALSTLLPWPTGRLTGRLDLLIDHALEGRTFIFRSPLCMHQMARLNWQHASRL